jgi:hypothetical protein
VAAHIVAIAPAVASAKRVGNVTAKAIRYRVEACSRMSDFDSWPLDSWPLDTPKRRDQKHELPPEQRVSGFDQNFTSANLAGATSAKSV